MAKERKKRNIDIHIDTKNVDVDITRANGETDINIDSQNVDVNFSKNQDEKDLTVKVEPGFLIKVLKSLGKLIKIK